MGRGPLSGVKILELAGIGPAPFCAMLLSDMGAEILRVDRKGVKGGTQYDVINRGRKSIALNLKTPEGVEAVLKLVEKSDVILEGFRPGVMERLGLGPEPCLARNPKLIFGRMTGWGQTGLYAQAAGHDINYISLSGALHAIGRSDTPAPPLNLIGDFGGGALYLAMGICAALFETSRSGKGQVIDAAMTDGSASLMALFYGLKEAGLWKDHRESNMLDGGAHYYDVYETLDRKFVSIGSIEPQFYALLREKAGLEGAEWDPQNDQEHWSGLKKKLGAIIKMKTRAEWDRLMEGTDVCYAPVLSMSEAPYHPHNQSRETFVERYGVMQPNVAPRFSRTKTEIQGPPPEIGAHNDSAFLDWGFSEIEIEQLRNSGAL